MKRLIMFTIMLISSLMLCGAVSAVNTVNTTVASQGSSDNCLTVGEVVAKQAMSDSKLALNKSNSSLLITNAGAHKINNHTTEGALEGIVNKTSSLSKDQKISYGKANILTLTNGNPLEFVFTTKLAGGNLMAKKFLVTWKGSSYLLQAFPTINVGLNMTTQEWNTAQDTFGNETYNMVSIANAWNSGAPVDMLAQVETTGRVAPGVLSGYIMTKGILARYAPDTLHEYIIVTNAGGYDDDAPIYLMTWNYKYYSMNGANPLESAYIYWKPNTGTGTLVLMKFNESLVNQFKTETGITVVSGTLNEIKFTSWLINLMKTDPGKLVTVEKTATINQENLNYIYGSDTQMGYGLSTTGRNYIMNLPNATAFKIQDNGYLFPILDYDTMVTKGKEMAEHAKSILDTIPGSSGPIAFETGPVYVTSYNILIGGIYDGIISVLKTYDPNNIMGIRNAATYDSFDSRSLGLVVVFLQRAGTSSDGSPIVTMLLARYNTDLDTISYLDPVQVINDKLYAQRNSDGTFNYTVSGGVMGLSSMPAWWRTAQIWGGNATYDYLNRFVKTSCCCWSPGIEITDDYIRSKLPLQSGQEYILIGVPYDTGSTYGVSKFIQGRLDDLTISPGSATFFTPGELYNLTVGIVVRWNSETQIGTASLINLAPDIFTKYNVTTTCLHGVLFSILGLLQKNESAPYNSSALIVYYEAILKGKTITTVDDLNALFTVSKEIYLTKSELDALTATGSDPVSYIENYVDTVKPVVSSVDPANGATKVAAGKTIKVTFSEAIKAGSGWFELKNSSGKAVAFKSSVSGKVLTIDPTSNLAESLYTLCIHSGAVTDMAGNPVAVKSTKFSVGTAPTVSKVDPKNGATKVAANKTIKVTFNENIKKGSKFWFELKNSSGKAVSFKSSISGKVLIIDPTSNLAESLYTLCIHSGAVTDMAGNPVAVKSTKFSVGTSPTVSKVDPINGATKVAAGKTIKVTFSEAIKKGSNFWVELKNSSGKAVAFASSVSGKVLTIDPKSSLAESLYTLVIHSGAVTDLAGNPVAVKSTKFSVGTSPTVSKVDPKNGATKVTRNKTIKVTFNENIKAGSNYWIELKTSSGKSVKINSKSISGKVLTINHAKLAANTKYKLILHTGAVTDKAGNPVALKTYTFTTGKT